MVLFRLVLFGLVCIQVAPVCEQLSVDVTFDPWALVGSIDSLLFFFIVFMCVLVSLFQSSQ